MFNKISGTKWENGNKTIIWKDDFDSFHITTASGEFEVVDSFERAIKVAEYLEQR
ncbi:MAG: hypothetical protein [Bacteriophage sp.]|nr:MAG: hypothetical protein [Bacteriophage sp.]